MLIGEHRHTIDEKGRISLPAKFRVEMGKKIVLARGLDRCVSVYTPKEWKKYSEGLAGNTLRADNRGFNRFTFSGASEAEVDSIGRILIPDFLTEWADLKDKVAVIGVDTKVEIWNEKTWLAYRDQNDRQADSLAEKVGGSARQ